MRHFLAVLVVSLVSAGAFAQAIDRDVLVTPDGTVYTVEQHTPSDSSGVAAIDILQLSIQTGDREPQRVLIPESLQAGFHSDAALAYDTASKTLFVLWTHMPNAMSSELLLASYREGKWQPAVSIDYRGNSSRANLRLAITRRVSQLQKDGSYADVSTLILHALWWDSSGQGEEARYAMLPIENGALAESAIEVHSLKEFVPSDDDTYNEVSEKFNAEILRHPAIVSSPMGSSVDIVFGDRAKNSFHLVTLHPIAEVRLHIPVGVVGGGGPAGGGKPLSVIAPANFSANWKGPITVIERGDSLIFANATDKALNYLTYSAGTWSDAKSIALSSKLTVETALAAVDKMVSSQ